MSRVQMNGEAVHAMSDAISYGMDRMWLVDLSNPGAVQQLVEAIEKAWEEGWIKGSPRRTCIVGFPSTNDV